MVRARGDDWHRRGAGKKCEPHPSFVLDHARRIVASRHGAAGYKLMRRAHARIETNGLECPVPMLGSHDVRRLARRRRPDVGSPASWRALADDRPRPGFSSSIKLLLAVPVSTMSCPQKPGAAHEVEPLRIVSGCPGHSVRAERRGTDVGRCGTADDQGRRQTCAGGPGLRPPRAAEQRHAGRAGDDGGPCRRAGGRGRRTDQGRLRSAGHVDDHPAARRPLAGLARD